MNMATKKQFITEAAPALILNANKRFEIVDNHVASKADYQNSYSVKYMRRYNLLKGIK